MELSPAALAVRFGVTGDWHGVLDPPRQDAIDQVLQRIQGLTVASDEQPRAVALDCQLDSLRVLLGDGDLRRARPSARECASECRLPRAPVHLARPFCAPPRLRRRRRSRAFFMRAKRRRRFGALLGRFTAATAAADRGVGRARALDCVAKLIALARCFTLARLFGSAFLGMSARSRRGPRFAAPAALGVADSAGGRGRGGGRAAVTSRRYGRPRARGVPRARGPARAESEHAGARRAQHLDNDVVLGGSQLIERLLDRFIDAGGGYLDRFVRFAHAAVTGVYCLNSRFRKNC